MRTYILDTNVLLSDPKSMFVFEEHNIIIPMWALEEIDKFKTEMNERGYNARTVSRYLDKLRQRGSLGDGVPLNGGGTLRVEWDKTLPSHREGYVDNAIIRLAKKLTEDHPDQDIRLVSRDTNMRVKADALGIKAENYKHDEHTDLEKQYGGVREVFAFGTDIDAFYRGEDVSDLIPEGIHPHEFLVLKSETQSAVARFDGKQLVRIPKHEAFGIAPRNKEQLFALDLLLNPNIPLVTISGQAGCGKTLLAMAAGLRMTADEMQFRKLLVSRPVVPMGRDIGFLPGPQPLDAKVLTPRGWVRMGDISVGSLVIGRDGQPTEVLGVYPKGKKPVYSVQTSEGTSTECCADHLWLTQTAEEFKRKKNGSVRSTQQIMDTIKHPRKPHRPNHYLPRVQPVSFDAQEIPVPAYTLGVLLGDGNMKGCAIASIDSEIVDRVSTEVGTLGCQLSKRKDTILYYVRRDSGDQDVNGNKPGRIVNIQHVDSHTTVTYPQMHFAVEATGMNRGTLADRCERGAVIDGYQYTFGDKTVTWANPLKEQLHRLGLLDTKAIDKFIPDIYKYNTIDVRLSILQGLMDTDGCIKDGGDASFHTISYQLASDVAEVVRGLGGRATIQTRDRVGQHGGEIVSGMPIISRHPCYVVQIKLLEFNPFFLKRKAEKHGGKYCHSPKITSIDYVGEKEVQCIRVANPEHLYVTDGFIVTHNTTEEKMAPWMQPIFDNLEILVPGNGKSKGSKEPSYNYLIDQGMLQVEALTFIRGRSLPKMFFLVDEAQNLSAHEIKTIVTRIGEGAKLVFTGDPSQIDNPYVDARTNGLTHVIERFKDSPIAGHITMRKGERSLLAEEAAKRL